MIIISHKSCMDGLAAAWVCKQVYPDAILHFAQYGDSVPWELIKSDESITIVDFSYPRHVLEELYKTVDGRIVVLDHHLTAQAYLEGLSYAHFDMNECGATMAWKYFFPTHPVPPLLQYVRDRDLWLWKEKNSREVSAALKLAPLTLESFSAAMTRDIFSLVREGAIVLQYESNMIASLANKATIEKIDNYPVPVVNSPVLQSELGEHLLTLYPEAAFAAIYFHTDSENRVYSLRSRPNFDVSAIAAKFGGGGHAQAAGFKAHLGKR